MRRLIGVLVAIALGLGIFALWPRSEDDPTPDPETTGTTTTTTTTSLPTPTTSIADTPTTSEGSHVVETVEEAETILREHYFMWFQGIYDENEESIRDLVLLESQVEAAVAQFGVMDFSERPTAEALHFSDTEILRSDSDCLSVWTDISADFRSGSSASVVVFRFVDRQWKLLSSWKQRGDLWEEDCVSSLQS